MGLPVAEADEAGAWIWPSPIWVTGAPVTLGAESWPSVASAMGVAVVMQVSCWIWPSPIWQTTVWAPAVTEAAEAALTAPVPVGLEEPRAWR